METLNEFTVYKQQNNLDAYFAKNLSEESRERVLENVKELMEVTDWSYFDANRVIHLESKNPQAFLERLLNDYEKLQRKKAAELAEE